MSFSRSQVNLIGKEIETNLDTAQALFAEYKEFLVARTLKPGAVKQVVWKQDKDQE